MSAFNRHVCISINVIEIFDSYKTKLLTFNKIFGMAFSMFN